MNWVVWRQHRRQFFVMGIILVLYAAVALPLGWHLWHLYRGAVAACGQATETCVEVHLTVTHSAWSATPNPNQNDGTGLLALLILAVPALLGVFLGVPLLAREYQAGTNLLVWTRSISRRAWLTDKLTWVLVATAGFAAAFTALTMWWSRAGDSLYLDRFASPMFSIQGMAPIGYAVLAVAIGITLGAWLKRGLLAAGLTLGLVLALEITVAQAVRPHYLAPVTKNIVTTRLDAGVPSPGPDTWVLNGTIVNRQGAVLDWTHPPKACIVQANSPPPQSFPVGGTQGSPPVSMPCLVAQGFHYRVTYQPASRYWDFQAIETALYLAMTAAALAVTYRLVLRRDA